jgi:hypothetical protein
MSENDTKQSAAKTVDRGDATDLGVPMLPGDGTEPVGPEDALGPGPKRGDYSGRIGPAGYQPHQVVPVADAAPGEPQVEVVKQRERAEERDDESGEKGGVTTSAS